MVELDRDATPGHSGTSLNSITFPDPATFLDDPRLNRKFTLPPKAGRPDPFEVTYSDFGRDDSDQLGPDDVLLICGPLLGSRLINSDKDLLAKSHGVRILNIDRPGFGGTCSEVAVQNRVKIWLDIVPALLKHLNISHVSLMSQSAGIIYALNTVLYLREWLNPARPYVAICAPWIHHSHTGNWVAFGLLNTLPKSILENYDRITQVSGACFGPISGFSTAISGSVLSVKERQPRDAYSNPEAIEFSRKLSPLIAERVHAENMQGLGQDAILCLKRTGEGDIWGPWEDIDRFVPLLADLEETRTRGVDSPHPTRLKVDVFYAETDHMIGKRKGPSWFEKCWQNEHHRQRIDYQSTVVPGVDHDTIITWDLMEKILVRMKERPSE